jgi:Lsr2
VTDRSDRPGFDAARSRLTRDRANGLDGADFELNLSKAHVDELRQTLAPYIKAARKTMTKEDSQRRGLGAIYIRIKQG